MWQTEHLLFVFKTFMKRLLKLISKYILFPQVSHYNNVTFLDMKSCKKTHHVNMDTLNKMKFTGKQEWL